MKKLILLLTLINFACFSMEKSIENQIAIFSNDSDQPIFLDSSAIQYSPLLKVFFESRKEYLKENIKINLPYEQLKKSLNIIDLFLETKKDESKESDLINSLQQLSLQELINTYFVADYFKIIELETKYLGLLFNKPGFIEQLAQLDKEQLQALEFIKTKNFLPSQAPEPLLKSVEDIYGSPDGSRYFIEFKDNSGRLFDNNANPIGNLLSNFFRIYWSPNGLYYFVRFRNCQGQLFNNNANSIGNPLSNASYINWSPDSSHYFIETRSRDFLGRLFDNNGDPIGNTLINVRSINWSPDSSRYFVIFRDDSGRFFDNNGNPIGTILSNIYSINWSPDGSRYFVIFRDDSGRFFDNNDNPIGNTLNNASSINWSPDGSRYFVRFRNGARQLFDKDGNSIGNPLSNTAYINWSPNSSRYFVTFNNASGLLFNNNGNSIGNILSDVYYISWSPNGSRYILKFINGCSGQLFDINANSILNFPIRIEWKANNTLMLIDSNNNLYENKLKFLVKKVQDGYQIYRAKDELPVGAPVQNKPLWIDTNTFKIKENDQEQYYSYQELSLLDLVTKAPVSGKAFCEA